LGHFLIGIFSLFLNIGVDVGSAQELLEITEIGLSKSNDPTLARREIHELVVERVTLKQISEMIGDKKVQKNLQLIKTKILKDSGKYILLYNHGKIESTNLGKQMSVSMKFSLMNLKKLLLERGLLYEHEGPPVVLPMISIIDKPHLTAYRWWVPEVEKNKSGVLQQKISSFYRELGLRLANNGFYLKNPLSTGEKNLIPQVYQLDTLRMEDYFFLGEFFKSQLVVKGEIRIENNSEKTEAFRIQVRATALHTGNGRVVAEITRTIDTEPGAFERVVGSKLDSGLAEVAGDLAAQLKEAWQRGTFGARLVKLTLRGDISYGNVNKFRELIQTKVTDIKSIRERAFDAQSVTFEVDTTVSSESLGERLSRIGTEGLKLQLDNVNNESIEIKMTGT